MWRQKNKILVDLGPNAKFLENAVKLNVNVENVDFAFISHVHDDYGGGLAAFLGANEKAHIYVRESIFNEYHAIDGEEKEYIGLDKRLYQKDKFRFSKDFHVIDDELDIFSHITGRKLTSSVNLTLMNEVDGALVRDDFNHEQCLVIKENDKHILMENCP